MSNSNNRDAGMKARLEIPVEQKFNVQAVEDKAWMKSFGKLASLRSEKARIDRIIDEEFGQIEAEDLR